MGIEDPYVAYCLDEAVLELASTIQYELDSIKGKSEQVKETRRRAVLARYLDTPMKFKEPIATSHA